MNLELVLGGAVQARTLRNACMRRARACGARVQLADASGQNVQCSPCMHAAYLFMQRRLPT
eukprot:2839916-Pleurochrysis_carterae.AAC.1